MGYRIPILSIGEIKLKIHLSSVKGLDGCFFGNIFYAKIAVDVYLFIYAISAHSGRFKINKRIFIGFKKILALYMPIPCLNAGIKTFYINFNVKFSA